MVTEPVRVISARQLAALRASQRRLRWGFGLAVGLAVAFAGSAAGRPAAPELLGGARATSPERGLLSAVDAPLYDEFLRQYTPLRADGDRRRYVTAQVLAAAALHRLDPDLLFALIAAESGFDSEAVSPKAARGLGQMVFATARDLRQLLGERKGDLRAALRAYYAGRGDRNLRGPDRDQYVARVSTRYASLKTKRSYERLNATPAG